MIRSTKSTRPIFCIVLLCTINIKSINSSICNRIPDGQGKPADGRFHLRILENTDKYTPGKTYTIKLEGVDAGQRSMPSVRHTFSGFMLVVENESGVLESTSTFGIFTLAPEDTFTKITCANMVTHTTTTPKSEIQVFWTAPVRGSGCVAFKATVIEQRNVWYMDDGPDGPLTKEFCEYEQSVDDSLKIPIKCCACSEAKYELTFEGLWSRNTHPTHHPSENNAVTKFSDIIGASHTIDYRFWQYGDIASEGLQQVAEHGTTTELETELRANRTNIRTIVKAKGLENVTGKTFAVFRVDPINSLFSFVTMIDPSPDWFLGVSGLDLCLENCTWAESKILDLYPWDAGTDSGPSYLVLYAILTTFLNVTYLLKSANEPTDPRDRIRPIRSDYPNDPRSPFYDPSGASMKPLASITLSRQRVYGRNCPEK